MTRFFLALIASLWTLPAFAIEQGHCHAETPCKIDGRSYHVREPDGWDGKSPLPVLLHFHGWMRQGDLIVKHQRIAGATKRRGVLLVAPNGQGRSWDFWDDQTADVGFANAVLADVARRYPIDREHLYVSGYSYGSAMAWRYACQSGNEVTALLAVAGTLRQSETCPQAPGEVRHVHGTADTVMNFPFGADGDETYPVLLWREKFGCTGGDHRGNWKAVDWLTFDRTVWSDCEAGKVSLDTHPGGHFIPHGWIGWQLDELLGRVPVYP
ncbi:MAG: polyhydroxybutyrate depolymerase [Rhodobacteraceae bacterium]|nr:polyhydroxybutyrate depolymerase [Paracoccaceae bacterium]